MIVTSLWEKKQQWSDSEDNITSFTDDSESSDIDIKDKYSAYDSTHYNHTFLSDTSFSAGFSPQNHKEVGAMSHGVGSNRLIELDH